MPKKHPDMPEFSQEEWDSCQAPLIKIDSVLKEFAKKHEYRFRDAWSHDWPMRDLSYRMKSKKGNYFLDKGIGIRLEDEGKKTKIYTFGLGVYTDYGLKELYAFIPFLQKKRYSWKRLFWTKTLAEFKETIDPERLKQLLEEAKQILDTFDESLLQEQKQ